MTDYMDYTCFDHVPAAIFVLEVTDAGEPVYAAFNTHALTISGRPLSDYLGRTALEVYPMAYGRGAYVRHKGVIKSGKPTSYEVDLPIAGTIRTIRTHLTPQLDDAGQVIRIFACSVDTTAEALARQAKAEFETLTSEMEQFVALAAHDLRAPMRNIALLTDLLREDFHDHGDGKLEILDLIDKIAIKSMDLISEVLSHTDCAAQVPDQSVFNFPALCHTICDTLDPEGRHSFDISLATLHADRTATMIALRNLIENAIKHGGRDRLDIVITVEEGMPGMIEVTLSDNGKGFTDAALRMMNGERFRADSGYGLFGVKRMIAARGGTLQACNHPNQKGAVVRFSLPGRVIDLRVGPGDSVPIPEPLRDAQRFTA